MWRKTLDSVLLLNVAASNLQDAISLVKQLHPGAVINDALCSEFYDNGDVNELRGFPHHFSITGYKSEADANSFAEFVNASGPGGDVPDFLNYIVMRRVEG